MSGVVIRCPNCGTSQSSLGECEACHEADTRYFCANHEPGRWLDGPMCAGCGARYGMKPVSSRAAPRERSQPPPGALPLPAPPVDELERVPVDVWSGPVHTPRTPEVFEIEPPGLELPDRRTGPLVPTDSLTLAATASGCARRVIVLFLILLALTALAIFGLLGVGIRLL